MTLAGRRCRCSAKLVDGVCRKHARFATGPAYPSDPTCETPFPCGAAQPPRKVERAVALPTPTPVPAVKDAEPAKPATKPRPQRKPASQAAKKPKPAAALAQPVELYVRTHLGTYRRARPSELRRALAALERAYRPAA